MILLSRATVSASGRLHFGAIPTLAASNAGRSFMETGVAWERRQFRTRRASPSRSVNGRLKVRAVGQFAIGLGVVCYDQSYLGHGNEAVRLQAFPEARGVAMRKTPLALNTSDFWKLNDLVDALYVIVDCHLRAKIKPSG